MEPFVSASTIATVPSAESAARGRDLLASRIAQAKDVVARVPDRFDVLLERPGVLPRCLVTTGIGTSEGHARHLAEVAARWAGQPARFASTGSLMRGAPEDAKHDWLVVFSQGLSPNARYALRDVEGWGGVVLVTGVVDPAADGDASNEVGAWLSDLETRGVVRIDMGCGAERGLLPRVIGARVGYPVGWSLLRTLAERRLEPLEALQFDPGLLFEVQVDAPIRAAGVFPDATPLLPFFSADRPLLLVSDGGVLELAEHLSLKIAEGLLLPQPRCVDVLHFAHGPLQGIADRPASILYLSRDGETKWSDRLAETLDPELHELRILRTRLAMPLAVVEYEAILDELVLRAGEESGVDLVEWAGAEREQALYAASPRLESASRIGSGAAVGPIRFEDAVWPEVEAWIEDGRRTALVALGSIEQHGPHLPLGTDRWIAQALVDGLAARLDDAVALPALAFGCASEHLDFPGTLHVEPETLEALLRDLLRSAVRHGFERAFIFTAHGGNIESLEAISHGLAKSLPDLELRIQTDLPISSMQALRVAAEGLDPHSAGPHAGEYETSVVARLRSGSVRRGALRPGRRVSGDEEQSLFYPSLRPNAENGVLGDPTRASAARGQRYLEGWLDLLEAAYRAAFDDSAGGVEKKRQ
jgi:creatinine amidohydrolase